jgi:hypothetical protein
MRLLKRLWAGDSKAAMEFDDAVRKARELEPDLSVESVIAKLLGDRPTDTMQRLHYAAATRRVKGMWQSTRPRSRMNEAEAGLVAPVANLREAPRLVDVSFLENARNPRLADFLVLTTGDERRKLRPLSTYGRMEDDALSGYAIDDTTGDYYRFEVPTADVKDGDTVRVSVTKGTRLDPNRPLAVGDLVRYAGVDNELDTTGWTVKSVDGPSGMISISRAGAKTHHVLPDKVVRDDQIDFSDGPVESGLADQEVWFPSKFQSVSDSLGPDSELAKAIFALPEGATIQVGPDVYVKEQSDSYWPDNNLLRTPLFRMIEGKNMPYWAMENDKYASAARIEQSILALENVDSPDLLSDRDIARLVKQLQSGPAVRSKAEINALAELARNRRLEERNLPTSDVAELPLTTDIRPEGPDRTDVSESAARTNVDKLAQWIDTNPRFKELKQAMWESADESGSYSPETQAAFADAVREVAERAGIADMPEVEKLIRQNGASQDRVIDALSTDSANMPEVEFRQIDDELGLPRYEVIRNGIAVGTVQRVKTSWSKSAKGTNYNYATGDANNRWAFTVSGRPDKSARTVDYASRSKAAEELLAAVDSLPATSLKWDRDGSGLDADAYAMTSDGRELRVKMSGSGRNRLWTLTVDGETVKEVAAGPGSGRQRWQDWLAENYGTSASVLIPSAQSGNRTSARTTDALRIPGLGRMREWMKMSTYSDDDLQSMLANPETDLDMRRLVEGEVRRRELRDIPADLVYPVPEPREIAFAQLPQRRRDMDRQQAEVALSQIGVPTILAVSGGRRDLVDGKLVLPVSNGYEVQVALLPDDTYSVDRVFKRAGRESVKGRVEGVYAEQLSDTVWDASNFRSNDFGTVGRQTDLSYVPEVKLEGTRQINGVDWARGWDGDWTGLDSSGNDVGRVDDAGLVALQTNDREGIDRLLEDFTVDPVAIPPANEDVELGTYDSNGDSYLHLSYEPLDKKWMLNRQSMDPPESMSRSIDESSSSEIPGDANPDDVAQALADKAGWSITMPSTVQELEADVAPDLNSVPTPGAGMAADRAISPLFGLGRRRTERARKELLSQPGTVGIVPVTATRQEILDAEQPFLSSNYKIALLGGLHSPVGDLNILMARNSVDLNDPDTFGPLSDPAGVINTLSGYAIDRGNGRIFRFEKTGRVRPEDLQRPIEEVLFNATVTYGNDPNGDGNLNFAGTPIEAEMPWRVVNAATMQTGPGVKARGYAPAPLLPEYVDALPNPRMVSLALAPDEIAKVDELNTELRKLSPLRPSRSFDSTEIRNAAKASNVNNPNVTPEAIDAGTPVVEVVTGADPMNPRRQRVMAMPGVDLVDGTFVPAGQPSVNIQTSTQSWQIGRAGAAWRRSVGRKWAGDGVQVRTGKSDGLSGSNVVFDAPASALGGSDAVDMSQRTLNRMTGGELLSTIGSMSTDDLQAALDSGLLTSAALSAIRQELDLRSIEEQAADIMNR